MDKVLKLIVGLGNPGDKYANTRHNVGFMALDSFLGVSDGDYKFEKKFNALVAEQGEGDNKVIFVKPQTFMNDSGRAVGAIAQFYKVKSTDILVIYDELALPFGTIRTRLGGSSAGHNGVTSVIEAIGSDFWRIRIGIQNEQKATWDSADFVLAPFNEEEVKELQTVVERTAPLIKQFSEQGNLPIETARPK